MDEVIINRICSCCKIEKPLAEFPKSAHAKYGRSNWCLECHRNYTAEDKHRKRNRERRSHLWHTNPEWKERERVKEEARRKVKWRETIINVLRTRAKVRNLEFDLEADDIPDIPKICPILQVPMLKHTPYTPSVDRMDSSKGYVKGNVWIISQKANGMKSNATMEELLTFSRYWLSLNPLN